MRTSKKSKIYQKGLRILWREINRLDIKSKEGPLNSFDRSDLVKMLKPLEATIKEEKRVVKTAVPEDKLVRQAKEILELYAAKVGSSESEDPTAPSGDDVG